MAVNKRARGAQYPLIQEYVFNFNDGVANLSSLTAASVDNVPKSGVTDFGSKASPVGLMSGVVYTPNGMSAAPTYFELFSMPVNAQIIGGELQIEAPYVGPSTVTLAIGDVNSGALYLAAQTLKAASWTNAPTGITNATANDPTLMTITNSTANGVAVGNVITISGCTGASAAYNGVFIADTASTTQVTCRNTALTTSLTLAGTPAGTFIAGRTALLIPAEATNQGGYATLVSTGYDAAAGAEVRGTLTFGDTTAATQGRVRVRIMYTIDGRMNEVQTT